MKLPFTIYDLRSAICKKSGGAVSPLTAGGAHGVTRPTALNRQSSIANRKSEKGVALIITLILLSVTLLMALAFMAISSREHGAVATSTDAATARLGADSALATAEAQVMSSILTTTNPYNFGLLVSTNYLPILVNSSIQSLGDFTNLFVSPRVPVYVPSPAGNYSTPTAYDYRFYLDVNRNGRFDSNGIVANVDNTGATNGTFSFQVGDPEWIGVLERPDAPYGPNNPFVARFAFIAIPTGNTLDLNYIHNQVFDEPATPSSVVIPVYNANTPVPDVFFRNQGVGSWEINLAAFLTDLNTNQWDIISDPYLYQEALTNSYPNTGRGFEDAQALLAYRYNNNYNSLASVQYLFGANGTNAFGFDGIDGYSDGPLQTNFDTNEDFYVNNDNPALPWAGADSTNHYFTPSDLFDTTKTENGAGLGFTDRLLNAGTNTYGGSTVSTYDRYTFYRLLSQLGTESAPESGKMNLNYDNLDPYIYTVNGVTYTNAPSATNFIPWTALGFFTNAADRLLRAYTANWLSQNFGDFTNTFGASTTNAFGIGNIPVYVNGQFTYTPAVNRLLQLAANIYDATVSNRTNGSPDYPDVFRPLFRTANGNLFISGYTNLSYNGIPNTVSGPDDLQLSIPSDPAYIANTFPNTLNFPPNDNIYGVPWIIGAKKGFPNFNEFSMENILSVTRRLQLTRTTNNIANSTPVITGTNQMYMLGLSSSIGIELWNSYAASYPNPVVIGMNENSALAITNDEGFPSSSPGIIQPITFTTNYSFTVNSWPGSGIGWSSSGAPKPNSFAVVTFNGPTLTNSVYRSPYANGATMPAGLTAPCLVPTNYFGFLGMPLLFETNSPNGFHFPQFGVVLTNQLQVFMLDLTNGVYHVIDYVHFAGPYSGFNVNSNLADVPIGNNHAGVWDTNYPAGVYSQGNSSPNALTYGIQNQISLSKSGTPPAGDAPTGDGLWQSDPQAIPLGGLISQQQAYFQAFFLPGNRTTTTTPPTTNLQLSMQAPYSPTRYVVQYFTWQANDPLVHYLASDIDAPPIYNTSTPKAGLTPYNGSQKFPPFATGLNLGALNDRYMPWGGNPAHPPNPNTPDDFNTANANNMTMKDSMATNSDAWDFPTGKLPTVGWIGRVHRGTPWQTVYLKSTDILANNGINLWSTWTGDNAKTFNQFFDAFNSAPFQDRQLFDLFTTAFNDNATRGQLSVNVGANVNDPASGLAAWSALFSGVVVPTNLLGGYTVIQPAGGAGTNSPLAQLVQGINDTRRNKNLFPQQVFTHAGDILAVPQLTEQLLPLLGVTNAAVSDEMEEWLPQQTMSLLRLGTPLYVIYSWGQALKPAPHGIVTSGPFFGMVTNYQVMSEFATRAVVRFDSTMTNILGTNSVINNRAVIENYNILPPD
jgi:hypothetical protein